jgi:hypothetical protein
MAFEITKQEILRQAAEFKKLYDQTRDKKYKDQELRLRRIVVELEAFSGGGGAESLDDLTDVTISAPANAQVLAYNSTSGQWENQFPGGGGGGDMYKSVYDVDNDGIVDGSETVQIIVRNSTGSTLTKGQVVYLSGATGNRPNAVLSRADVEVTATKTIGIVVANIANNSDGFVAVSGTLHDLDTSAFTAGDAVWLSAATAGAFTATVPAEPNYAVFVGYIARAHPTQGRIVLHIQNGYELNELHGVLISSEANNDLLTYESSTGLWKNKTISALGIVPTSRQLTINGTTYDLTADRSWTVTGSSQWVDVTGGIQYSDNVGIDVNLSRMTQVDLNNLYPNFTISNYDTLNNGAVIYRNLSGGANISPLVNGTTYYVKKLTGTVNPVGGLYKDNQVELYSNAGLTSVIYLTTNIVANHYLEQSNRTLSNTIIANQNFQIDDGFLLINAKKYKSGDVHWISPRATFVDSFLDDEGLYEVDTQAARATTLLIGPYTETNTNPLVNTNGVIVLYSDSQNSFVGVTWNGIKYGITPVLPALTSNTTSIGGYYSGMGIASYLTVSDTQPSFGVLAKDQSGNGRGAVNFTIYNNKVVHTFNNVLDSGSGRMGISVVPAEMLHVGNPETLVNTTVRIDSNAATSTTISSQLAFYRTINNAVINGAILLGKVSAYGLGTTPSTYVEGASIEFRSITGAWSTTSNRSAQMLFFTRNANTFAERMRLTQDGKLFINTTTDAGFRLDVNGTARIQNALTLGSLASDPTGANGMIYYNTTTNKFRGYENGVWVNLI